MADVVSVGDYVNYDANDNGSYSYTTEKSLTGSSTTSTFNSSDTMKWRVLSVNKESGTVELMSADVTGKSVTLYGAAGFANAETVLNKVGEVYGYGKGATGGRSITIEDLEKYSSYDKSTYSGYGTTKTYTSGKFFKEIKDNEGNVIGYEKTVTTASSSNKVTMTLTYYEIREASIAQGHYDDTVYKMLFRNSADSNNKNYFLASKGYSNGVFRVYTVAGGCFYDTIGMFTPDYYQNTISRFSVPVVSLETNILTSGQDENGAWNLIVE